MITADTHIFYMQQALREANKAFAKNEVPIGCIIVGPQGILARAHNLVEHKKTQTAHAEMLAVQKASKKLGDWRLEHCWIYVTLEPCAMCMNLLLLSRVSGLLYGATSPIFGFQLDNSGIFQLYRKDKIIIKTGILAEESSNLLKRFFQERRKKGEQ